MYDVRATCCGTSERVRQLLFAYDGSFKMFVLEEEKLPSSSLHEVVQEVTVLKPRFTGFWPSYEGTGSNREKPRFAGFWPSYEGTGSNRGKCLEIPRIFEQNRKHWGQKDPMRVLTG
ncbi:hypothetical protein AVEN_171728-1 [Araneus ventricosus]|uniref:Uncharacterized protein n=1 Tax=Araneus ventricosus TaxID=182803 RepID=A0A4Y2LJ99_ARAVE|nr:hypothetical protein AVEN_171728-1 [Araneus ventricosus]